MSKPFQSDEIMQGYKAWKAMGVGGTSHNWVGYMSALSAEKTMAYGANETISPGFYEDPQRIAAGWSKAAELQKANARKSFIKTPLPDRQGPRARAKPFVFPQRERNSDEPQDLELMKAYLDMFDQLGQGNKDSTEWKTSCLEKQGKALFVRACIPLTPLAGPTQGGNFHPRH